MVLHAVFIRGFIYFIIPQSLVRCSQTPPILFWAELLNSPKEKFLSCFHIAEACLSFQDLEIASHPFWKGRCTSLPFSSAYYRTRSVKQLQITTGNPTVCAPECTESNFYYYLQFCTTIEIRDVKIF